MIMYENRSGSQRSTSTGSAAEQEAVSDFATSVAGTLGSGGEGLWPDAVAAPTGDLLRLHEVAASQGWFELGPEGALDFLVAGFGLLVVSPVIVAVAIAGDAAIGWPVGVTTPAVEGRTIRGGITMTPEYAALLVALVVYTSSHIAEIVRGSIQAVHKGQGEAATALALSAAQRMRLIILPQAMRIAVPALGNQYLNLTKNSSLAVAISYFELTKITTLSIGNRAPAVPSFTLLLLIYLALSLAISALGNPRDPRQARGAQPSPGPDASQDVTSGRAHAWSTSTSFAGPRA
jgi:ABC-type amino acid transport system permease subunit